MIKDIYSNIRGELIFNDLNTWVQIYDRDGSRYNPNLIIPNELAIKYMINFLQECLKQIKEGDYGIRKK